MQKKSMINNVNLPRKAGECLFKTRRFKILYGGRSSAKSSSVARYLVLRAHTEKLRILCTRELQSSIRDSVHKLISDIISEYGLEADFVIGRDNITSTAGSEFMFTGLKANGSKIKSTEGIDIAYVEEAENITAENWELLIPTIRKDGSEIIVVFNPRDQLDDTYVRFIKPHLQELESTGSYDDDTYSIIRMNYSDNPYLPEESRREMERTKQSDYQKYLHTWEGKPLGSSDYAIISPLWIQAAIDSHKTLGFKARGIKAVGVDLADEGNDNKGIILRHGSVVTHADSWTSGDLTGCIEQAFNLAKNEGATDLVYDQVGIGAAVKVYTNTLQGRDRFTVTGFLGNDIPSEPNELYKGDRPNHDVFRNHRAQAFWLLRDRFEATYNAIENGVYTDPADMISLDSKLPYLDELCSELSRIERKHGNTNGMIQLESKQDMKKRGFKSPGLADALMYSFSTPPLIDEAWGTPINYNNNRNI